MGTCAVNGGNRHAVDWMSAPGEPPTTSHKALCKYRRPRAGPPVMLGHRDRSYALRFHRQTAAPRPIRPEPNNRSAPGTGMGAYMG